MAYSTPAQVIAQLGRTGSEANDRTPALAPQAIAAADRWIDEHCARSFERSPATVREYRAPDRLNRRANPCRLVIDDLVTATEVAVRGGYRLPWEAVADDDWAYGDAAPGEPYTEIWKLPDRGSWPWAAPPVKTVRVTGTHGWAAVPADVVQAAILLACHQIAVMSGPYQVGAEFEAPTFGTMAEYSEVRKLLAPYRRLGRR